MTSTSLTLVVPHDFNFLRTVYSHGWCSLPPFFLSRREQRLDRLLSLTDGTLVLCSMRDAGGRIHVRALSSMPLSAGERAEVRVVLRSCLRMGEDFSRCHAAARRHPEHRWIARHRAGRMLRSPTVFEDAVKMICTTNCTWALTTTMVSRFVEELGRPFGNGVNDFPTPEAFAGASEQFLRKRCTTGYRAPSILELATKVASGRLAIEAFRSSDKSTEELFKELQLIKGIGPYAAGNLLRLLGRYEHLALDSWVRSQYSRIHRDGRRVNDAAIERHYAPYGEWRGLLFWLEMTREWHGDKFPLEG